MGLADDGWQLGRQRAAKRLGAIAAAVSVSAPLAVLIPSHVANAGGPLWDTGCVTWKNSPPNQADLRKEGDYLGADAWSMITRSYAGSSDWPDNACRSDNGYTVQANVRLDGYINGVYQGVCNSGSNKESDGYAAESQGCVSSSYTHVLVGGQAHAWFSGTKYSSAWTDSLLGRW